MQKKNIGTKGSHTVWERYLKEFSVDGTKIYVKDIKNGNTFCTNTNNIGKVNHIYTITKKISEKDIDACKRFYQLGELRNDDDVFIHMLVSFLNDEIILPVKNGDSLSEKINRFVSKTVNDNGLNNFQRNQEKLFTFYESNYLPLFEILLNGDVSFYNDLIQDIENMELGFRAARALKTSNFFYRHSFYLMSLLIDDKDAKKILREEVNKQQKFLEKHMESKFTFSKDKYFNSYYLLTFILSQLFRTEKIMDTYKQVGALMKEHFPQYIDNEQSLSVIMLHYQIYNIALKMILKKSKLIIIENNTDVKFITSDHPVANTYLFIGKFRELKEDEFELYYPLSPHKGLLFSERDIYRNTNIITPTKNDIHGYNELIKQASYKYIFSCEQFE